jgi:hypothetical protein
VVAVVVVRQILELLAVAVAVVLVVDKQIALA